MAAKKYKWHKIAGQVGDIQWTAGDIGEAELEGKKICIARFGGGTGSADAAAAGATMYAFSHVCPHAGAPMMDGYTSGDCQVVCPVHHLKFNLKTGGRDVNGEGYSLKTYPVESREDGVYVGVEEGGGFFKKWF